MNKYNKSNSLPNTRCQPRISVLGKQLTNNGSQQQNSDLVIFGNYTINKKYILGKGFCSKVYKAIHNQTKQKYAIKIIQLSQIKTAVEKRFLRNEIKYLKLLKQAKNVLNINEIITTDSKLAIVSQICKQSIYQKLRSKNGSEKVPLDRSEAIKIMKDVVNGYCEMREHYLIHRDIKPANILINYRGEAKLADLGFCTHDDDIIEDKYVNVGSPLYMAPEVLKGNHYGEKADVWAIGLVFLEMMIANLPWKDCKETQLRSNILKQDISSLIPADLSPQYRQVLLKSLQFDQKDRIGISQLKKTFIKQQKPQKRSIIQIDNLISKRTKTRLASRQQIIMENTPTNQSTQIQKNTKPNFNAIKEKVIAQYCSHHSLQQLIKNKKNQINFQNIEGSQKVLKLKLKLNPNNHNNNNNNNNNNYNNTTNNKNGGNEHDNNLNDKQKTSQLTASLNKQQMSKLHFCRFLFKVLQIILNSNNNINCSYFDFDDQFPQLLAKYILSIFHQIKNVKSDIRNLYQLKAYKKSVEYIKLMIIVNKYEKNYTQFFNIKFKEDITAKTIEIRYLLERVLYFIKNAADHLKLIREELFKSDVEILRDDDVSQFAWLMNCLVVVRDEVKGGRDSGRDGYRVENLMRKNGGKFGVSLEEFNAICKMTLS